MTLNLKKNNLKVKYFLAFCITIGYILVCLFGIVFNGEVFNFVFTGYTVFEAIVIKELFENNKKVKESE